MLKLIWICCCLCACFSQAAAQENLRDFYLATVPKSGSHLIIKLIVMMTGRYPNGLHDLHPLYPHISDDDFEKALLRYKNENHFAFNHTGKYGDFFSRFSEKHPEYLRILMIRDLRDILVSYTYHISKSLEAAFGPLSFDEKLRLVLDLENSSVSREFERDVCVALEWMDRPDVLVYRFEDIVGPAGKGSLDRQEKVVKRLAADLGVDLTEELMEKIERDLFGKDSGPSVAGTFRSGQIGGWSSYFLPEHMHLFEKHWGAYQSAFGYFD